MELKNIEAFLKIVETGSFSAAAEALHISQPTISVRIQQLEKELNIPLFIRVDGRKVKLTLYGEKIFPYFREALDLIEQGCNVLKREPNENEKIMISCPNHMGVEILPELLNTLYTTFPSIDFKVQIETTKNTIEGIRNHEVDIGFAYITHASAEKNKDLSMVHVADQKNILVCSPEHALAKRKKVSVKELNNERVIIYDRDFSTTRMVESFLQANGLTDYKKTEINNLGWIKMMVRKGMGIAFLQNIIVREELSSGKLVEVSMNEMLPTTSIYLAFSHDLDNRIRKTTIDTTRSLFMKIS